MFPKLAIRKALAFFRFSPFLVISLPYDPEPFTLNATELYNCVFHINSVAITPPREELSSVDVEISRSNKI
jgi:hypothetical protein